MRKLALSLLALLATAAVVQAQTIPQPVMPPGAIGCAYNTSPPTLTNGNAGLVQCDSTGKLLFGGSISASISAEATAAAPSYVEGTANAFSQDLSGHLRTIATQGTSPWVVSGTVTATNPSVGTLSAAAPTSATLAGLSDGTNLQPWLTAIALGDGVNGNNTGAVSAWVFNGTTFDRARGDATNGAWVNVKASALTNYPVTDGGNVTLGAKADARSTATDTTAVTVMQVLKEISFMEQNPTSRAVTNAGTFAVQATLPTTATIAAGNAVVPAPSAEAGAGLSTVSSSALAANTVIKASAGNLYSFNVSADSTLSGAAWWIMIYNATSAPVDGAVTPAKCYAVPSGATSYNAAFPVPVAFATGIVIGVSTTGCFTKTASTHAFISGDYK